MATPTGEGPLRLPFGGTWWRSRGGESFVVERRRGDSSVWDEEGWFGSRREAKRAARDLTRTHPDEEFRVRQARRPAAG